MSDVFHLHQIAGDFIEINLDGKTLKITPLTMRGRGAIGSVFCSQVQSPIASVMELKSILPEESYKVALESAVKRQQYWPPAIDSQEALEVMAANLTMQTALLAEMLRKYHPADCEQLAIELMDSNTPIEYARIGAYGWTARRPDEPDFRKPPETP